MTYQVIEVNGEPVEFPSDMTDEEISAILRTQQAPPEPVVAPEIPAEAEEEEGNAALEFLKQNMEIPGGVAGSLTGMAAGSFAGPPGVIAGGIIGGALGSGGGSLASDALTGEDLNYANAVKEALMSAGIDVALLGTGKILGPLYRTWRNGGRTPQEMADFIVGQGRAGTETGSLESVKASQKLLTDQGATLTPFQTGRASGYGAFFERLADTGILSQGIMAKNYNAVNDAVYKALKDIMGGGQITPGRVGQDIYEVVAAGKQALMNQYGTGLTELQKTLGKTSVDTAALKGFLAKYAKSNWLPTVGEPKVNQKIWEMVQTQIKNLKDVSNIPANELIQWEKKLMDDIGALVNEGGVYNGLIDRQSGELMSNLREVIGRSLNASSKDAGSQYRALNQTYSQGVSELLPELNKSFVTAAQKGDYSRLGEMLYGNGSTDRMAAMLRSVDRAFNDMKIAGVTPPIKDADAAKDLIRQGYLQKFFATTAGEFDIKDFARKASQFSDPKMAEKLRLIAGPYSKSVKQLMNVMQEATNKPTSNLGELMLRAKEYGAMAGMGYGVYSGDASLIAGSSAILFTPVVLAKIATDPKYVNRLIAFNNRTFTNKEAMGLAFTNAFSDLLLEAGEAEDK